MNQNAVEYIKNHIKEFLPLEYQDAEVEFCSEWGDGSILVTEAI